MPGTVIPRARSGPRPLSQIQRDDVLLVGDETQDNLKPHGIATMTVSRALLKKFESYHCPGSHQLRIIHGGQGKLNIAAFTTIHLQSSISNYVLREINDSWKVLRSDSALQFNSKLCNAEVLLVLYAPTRILPMSYISAKTELRPQIVLGTPSYACN